MKKTKNNKKQLRKARRQKNYSDFHHNCSLNPSLLPKNFTANSDDNCLLVFVEENNFDPELCQVLSNLFNKTILVAIGEASS